MLYDLNNTLGARTRWNRHYCQPREARGYGSLTHSKSALAGCSKKGGDETEQDSYKQHRGI